MNDKEMIEINLDDIEVLDDFNSFKEISVIPEFAKPLVDKTKECLKDATNILVALPSFIEIIKTSVPKKVFEAVLSREDSAKLAAGAVKLLNKKDGTMIATLVDPITNKFLKQVPLKDIKITPQLGTAISNFTNQLQMAKVIALIEDVQKEVSNVLQGLENDRLAGALSCQQKYLQAIKINNSSLRNDMLLRIVMDAEDCRNKLMFSQKESLKFIINQPKSFFGKLLPGSSDQKKIDAKLNEIRMNLQAINLTSIVEVMVYNELGEIEAAKESLSYYSNYIESSFLSIEGLVDRLDELDVRPYWKKGLQKINDNIDKLDYSCKLLEGGNKNGN